MYFSTYAGLTCPQSTFLLARVTEFGLLTAGLPPYSSLLALILTQGVFTYLIALTLAAKPGPETWYILGSSLADSLLVCRWQPFLRLGFVAVIVIFGWRGLWWFVRVSLDPWSYFYSSRVESGLWYFIFIYQLYFCLFARVVAVWWKATGPGLEFRPFPLIFTCWYTLGTSLVFPSPKLLLILLFWLCGCCECWTCSPPLKLLQLRTGILYSTDECSLLTSIELFLLLAVLFSVMQGFVFRFGMGGFGLYSEPQVARRRGQAGVGCFCFSFTIGFEFGLGFGFGFGFRWLDMRLLFRDFVGSLKRALLGLIALLLLTGWKLVVQLSEQSLDLRCSQLPTSTTFNELLTQLFLPSGPVRPESSPQRWTSLPPLPICMTADSSQLPWKSELFMFMFMFMLLFVLYWIWFMESFRLVLLLLLGLLLGFLGGWWGFRWLEVWELFSEEFFWLFDADYAARWGLLSVPRLWTIRRCLGLGSLFLYMPWMAYILRGTLMLYS